MARVSEEISKANSTSQGKTDANLANDSNHLGGIPANEYATKAYVQEYHNTKETAQKSYIDQQDQAILNQAKEYTNSQIRNQDFSSFAKVTDVQALDEKLSDEIETGLTAQKNYTDQKTNQIVSDVNANFQEVEGAISTLNGTVNNLFGSVSNGKSQIAGAITDKGVPTSASDSFSTMASNIRSIPSGGGSTDPNYVNTSDATATASDILNGKTAYVKGQKIYGNFIYTKENNYEINPDNPYPNKAEVELVYAEKEGELDINKIKHNDYDIYDISSDNRLLIAYDEDENKLKTFLKGTNLFGEEAFVQNKNQAGELLTPEYTFQELNITNIENYKLGKIKFSIMNSEENASGYECRIAILFIHAIESTVSEPRYKCFIFRISTFNGEITFQNEQIEIGTTGNTNSAIYYNRWEINSTDMTTDSSSSGSVDLVWSSDSYKLAVVCPPIGEIYNFQNTYLGTQEDYTKVVEKLKTITVSSNAMVKDTYYKHIDFYNNDRILNVVRTERYMGTSYIHNTFILDSNFETIESHSSNIHTPIAFSNDGLYLIGRDGIIYSSTINYSTGDINTALVYDTGIGNITKAIFSKDNKFLVVKGNGVDGNEGIYILSTDFSNNTFSILYQYVDKYSDFNIISNLKSFEIEDSQEIVSTIVDEEVLVGLKYQGQTFYNNIFNKSRYTAKQEDVKSGKTFIGFNGIPETGTMEVNE